MSQLVQLLMKLGASLIGALVQLTLVGLVLLWVINLVLPVGKEGEWNWMAIMLALVVLAGLVGLGVWCVMSAVTVLDKFQQEDAEERRRR